jgi:DNA-binding LacI/PurR family transcriptional regulator
MLDAPHPRYADRSGLDVTREHDGDPVASPSSSSDHDPVEGVFSVNVADRNGARSAAQHLVDLGHRRIGLLMSGAHGPQGIVEDPHLLIDRHASRQRMLGWFDALDEASIKPTIARQPDASVNAVRGAALLPLDREDRPTAVLCFSDVIAQGVIQTAVDLGIRVPEELSVVGFDDSPLAARTRPGITTVRQDSKAKGRAAAAALIAAIERSRTGAGGDVQQILLPTELVFRDSTAPPAA